MQITIQNFLINTTNNKLTLEFDNKETHTLSFEYLRISSPLITKEQGKAVLTSHKKSIKLQAIEIVAKHGYRLVFDDNHSAIYSDGYLEKLVTEYQPRWDKYLIELKASGHSREDMIDITQL